MAKIKQRVGGHKKTSGATVAPYVRTVARRPPSPYIPNSDGVGVTSKTQVDTTMEILAAGADPAKQMELIPPKALSFESLLEYQEIVRSSPAKLKEIGDMIGAKSYNPSRGKKDYEENNSVIISLWEEGYPDLSKGVMPHMGMEEDDIDFAAGNLSTLSKITHPVNKDLYFAGGLGNPEIKTNPDSKLASIAVS